MSFINYESQKKHQEIQQSVLKQKYTIEKKSRASTLEALLAMESELQLYFANIVQCINLVNRHVQSESIQNCLLPNTVEHLNISMNDAHLFRQLFQNSVLLIELFESITHKCTTCCSFNPMDNKDIVPLNEIRKIYIQYFKMLKVSRALHKSVLILLDGSNKNTSEKVDDFDMKTSTSDSTISSFLTDVVCTSSPILKEKQNSKN